VRDKPVHLVHPVPGTAETQSPGGNDDPEPGHGEGQTGFRLSTEPGFPALQPSEFRFLNACLPYKHPAASSLSFQPIKGSAVRSHSVCDRVLPVDNRRRYCIAPTCGGRIRGPLQPEAARVR